MAVACNIELAVHKNKMYSGKLYFIFTLYFIKWLYLVLFNSCTLYFYHVIKFVKSKVGRHFCQLK